MADITPTVRQISPSIRSITWSAVTSADPGVAFQAPYAMSAVAAVQIDGTFGGATVTLAGSNDDVTYFTLKDLSGNDVSATAAALVDLSTAALYIKPVVTGGTAEDIDVTMVVRG